MRKNVTKVAAALLSAAMVVTSVSVPGTTSEAASVKISAKKATIYAGPAKKTVALTVKKGSTNLTKKCKWTSSNKKVATVGAKTGKVTAKKKGTATITAKYGKKSYKCKVTVKAYKYATKLTVSPTSKTLTVGKTQKITVKYTGSPTTTGVSFKSNNTAVASVSSKGVITAKKAGTAKITVSTKKNVAKKTLTKTITVTVKAASTATASPSAAPASEAPASAAPTAAASAAPTAAASAAPTAAAPTTEPSKEPSRVSEIKILSDTAYTNPADEGKDNAGVEAFVYYDVLDQYGKSMRESTDINWTTSPAGGKADKSTGRIKVSKGTSDGKAQKFNYGDLIYLTGVHTKTGTTVQQQVKVGLEEAVNSIKVAGFVSKDNKTKLVKTLPANFAKDTWYMVYQTYNRDGNPLDVTAHRRYREQDLTFISNDPMKISASLDKDAAGKEKETPIITIKNDDGTTTDYASICVNPEMYADRGGEVQMTAIANRTGNKTDFIVNIGESAQLKSLEVSVPSGVVVADGDEVELDYVAMDTKGNKVTSYETIVRTSNSLQMNATEGTMTISEKDDGTAKIVWKDKYDPEESKVYEEGFASDGIDRRVMLLTTVIGGDMKQTEMNVQDIRIPTKITATGLADFVANDGVTTAAPLGDADNFKYEDQYGKALGKKKVKAFFDTATTKGFGYASNKAYYGIKVEVPTNGTMEDTNLLKGAKGYVVSGADVTGKTSIKLRANAQKEASEETYKFSVATLSTSNASKAGDVTEWNTGKVFSQTIASVPVKKLSDFTITDLKALSEVYAGAPDNVGKRLDAGEANAKDVGLSKVYFHSDSYGRDKYNPTYKVVGKYKGNDVKVPAKYLIEGLDSKFKVDNTDVKNGDAYEVYVGAFKNGNGGIKESQLFNYGAYGNPAKNAGFELAVAVANEGNIDTIKGDIDDAVAKIGTDTVVSTKATLDEKLTDLGTKIDEKGRATTKQADVKTKMTALKEKVEALGTDDANTVKASAAYKKLTSYVGDDGAKDFYDDFDKVNEIVGTGDATAAECGILGKIAAAINISNDEWQAVSPASNKELFAKALKDFRAAIEGNSGVMGDENYFKKAYTLNADYNQLETAVTAAGDKIETSLWMAVKRAYEDIKTANDFVKADGENNSAKVKTLITALNALNAEYAADNTLSGVTTAVTGMTTTSIPAVVNSNYVTWLYNFKSGKAKIDALKDVKDFTAEAGKTAVTNAKKYFTDNAAVTDLAYNGSFSTESGNVVAAITKYVTALKNTMALESATSTVETVRKEVTVCAAPSQPVKFVMDAKATLNPTGTYLGATTDTALKINELSFKGAGKMFSTDKDNRTNQILINLYDQYGIAIDEKYKDDVVYTVSLTKESKTEITHKDGGIEIANNGAENPVISGVEVGDTFTITAKLKGKEITAKCNLTVGADKMAKIDTSTDGSKSDENFRKNCLGYIK